MKEYKDYRNKILQTLSNEARKKYGNIQSGCWHNEQRETYTHILPLVGKNTRKSRMEAIKKYLGISIDDNFLTKKSKEKKESLHPYAHHLNSSQLLCYMTFRNMLTEKHTPKEPLIKLLESLGINISSKAICKFEFSDGLKWEQRNESEGTSFDFHIFESDKSKEYFFEIKFTENGFGKANNDERHKNKIKEVYIKKIQESIQKQPSVEECMKYYQLFRNIIRSNSDLKTVVFITDENNPATANDIKEFRKKFLKSSSANIKFLTWQEICKKWPKEVEKEKPFQFTCFENTPPV